MSSSNAWTLAMIPWDRKEGVSTKPFFVLFLHFYVKSLHCWLSIASRGHSDQLCVCINLVFLHVTEVFGPLSHSFSGRTGHNHTNRVTLLFYHQAVMWWVSVSTTRSSAGRATSFPSPHGKNQKPFLFFEVSAVALLMTSKSNFSASPLAQSLEDCHASYPCTFFKGIVQRNIYHLYPFPPHQCVSGGSGYIF